VFWIISFISGLAEGFIGPVYIIFLRSFDLSFFQVNMMNVVFMSTIFLFEIPTGSVADYFGRKISVIIGLLIWALSMLVYGLSSNFYGFITAEIIGGFGATFITGALEAWIVDSTAKERRVRKLRINEIFGKGNVSKNIGFAIGGFFAGLLASISLRYPFFLSSSIFLISAFVGSLLMKENFIRRKIKGIAKTVKDIFKIARYSINFARSNRMIVYFSLASLLTMFAFQVTLQFWQPYFLQLKVPISMFGIIWVFMISFLSLGSYFGGKLSKKFQNEKPLILISTLIGALVYFGFGLLLDFQIAFISLLVWELHVGISDPATKAYYNEFIPKKQRATLINLKSMMGKVGQVGSLLLTGYVADVYGLQLPFFLGAFAMLTGLVFYSLIKKQ
jgi:MFS family permease